MREHLFAHDLALLSQEERASMGRTTGRNDPCPCGSGRKYKRCCLGTATLADDTSPAGDPRAGAPSPAQEVLDELQRAQAGQEFGGLEDVQAFAHEFMVDRNRRPLKDFDGLSSEQMHRFLSFPFDSPGLVRFSEELDQQPDAPLAELFRCIIEAIDEKGLKLTPKGNLPRALSQDAARRAMSEVEYEDFTSIVKIRSEEDYQDLWVARKIAELAGLLRKQHGRLFRTRRCVTLTDSGSLSRVYPLLLVTLATKFNWAYRDRYPELWIVQHSFAFTLRLLQRHGEQWKDTAFYEDAFVRAYPNALAECPDTQHFTPERTLSRCFRIRALERFALYCGLVEMEPVGKRRLLDDSPRVRALPLLDAVVSFHV